MHVADILSSKGYEVITAAASDSLATALALMVEHRVGAVLVLDAQKAIVGILSERDLVRALHQYGRDAFERTVGELMTAPVITCSPRDPATAIMGMMTAQRFRHVPVVEGGRLLGLISIGDVVKGQIEEVQAEVDALRRYISL
ncbi:MAG: CBS domain-containing protein [Rhodospirillales bacterium]|jgi:CBS domain-containing protein|nr:CBS domain-containing protein [Rhodospirillales bacterium]